jgi:hypothetical protein
MSSIVEHTYPQIVWRDRRKKLWNPIHKKALKNLPEERVRLRVIEQLMQAGWSKHRISTEEAIGEIGDTAMRTDIICYTQQFEPRLLVECKAEHVPISAKTAEQVGRYNQKVGAPYLLMTNGISDFWYEISDGSDRVVEREEGPDFLADDSVGTDHDFEYWQSRGFAGKKANPDLRKWIASTLPDIWLPEEQHTIQFITFGDGPSDVNLSHYYRIMPISDDRRLAITTLNTAFGGNRMIVILNVENDNKAVIEINLDLLFDDKKGNSSLYSESGIRTFDFLKYVTITELHTAEDIAEQLDQLFVEYVA